MLLLAANSNNGQTKTNDSNDISAQKVLQSGEHCPRPSIPPRGADSQKAGTNARRGCGHKGRTSGDLSCRPQDHGTMAPNFAEVL